MDNQNPSNDFSPAPPSSEGPPQESTPQNANPADVSPPDPGSAPAAPPSEAIPPAAPSYGADYPAPGQNADPYAYNAGSQPQPPSYTPPAAPGADYNYSAVPGQAPGDPQAYPPPPPAPPMMAPPPMIPPTRPSNGKATAGLVLGILSIVFGVLMGWLFYPAILALPMAIIGIILSIKSRKELPPGTPGGYSTAGLVLSIIGLVFAILSISCYSLLIYSAVQDFQDIDDLQYILDELDLAGKLFKHAAFR